MKKQSTVERWRAHVAAVQRELKNAAAPPRSIEHLLHEIYREFWPWLPSQLPVATTPPAPPHQPTCAHSNAQTTALGAMIRKPKRGDRVLLSIPAVTCPDCGMTVAIVR
jgi:hypothetical protein